MEPAQPRLLAPGKCEQCRRPLDDDRFALWFDHASKQRSCEHLVCGTCRGIMCGWRRRECPNSKCGKRFNMIQDAITPDVASAPDFFDFVNHTETGRITKGELCDWYITNFSMSPEDATGMVD